MCCWLIGMPHWMRSSWPSKGGLCKFIQTKVVARKPSIWYTKHLRPWLIRMLARDMTMEWVSTSQLQCSVPDTATQDAANVLPNEALLLRQSRRNLQSQGRSDRLKQHPKHHSRSKVSCWRRSGIFWSSCLAMCEVMWFPKTFLRSRGWFWRNGWWIQVQATQLQEIQSSRPSLRLRPHQIQ